MDDAKLLEQVRVTQARLAMLAPETCLSDSAAALCGRLAEARAREADATHKVSLPDPWRRAVFIALGRRYGLHLHRHAGQRRQTLMVCVPPSFFSRALGRAVERGPFSRRAEALRVGLRCELRHAAPGCVRERRERVETRGTVDVR